eukprot:945954-Alexandrium_andersonii.AAC.3
MEGHAEISPRMATHSSSVLAKRDASLPAPDHAYAEMKRHGKREPHDTRTITTRPKSKARLKGVVRG